MAEGACMPHKKAGNGIHSSCWRDGMMIDLWAAVSNNNNSDIGAMHCFFVACRRVSDHECETLGASRIWMHPIHSQGTCLYIYVCFNAQGYIYKTGQNERDWFWPISVLLAFNFKIINCDNSILNRVLWCRCSVTRATSSWKQRQRAGSCRS